MLKKMLVGALAGVMLFSSTVLAREFDIEINDEPISAKAVLKENEEDYTKTNSADYERDFINFNDKIYLPLRDTFESLGCKVAWDNINKAVTVVDNSDKTLFNIKDDKIIFFDDVEIDDDAIIKENNTYYVYIKCLSLLGNEYAFLSNKIDKVKIYYFSEEEIQKMEKINDKFNDENIELAKECAKITRFNTDESYSMDAFYALGIVLSIMSNDNLDYSIKYIEENDNQYVIKLTESNKKHYMAFMKYEDDFDELIVKFIKNKIEILDNILSFKNGEISKEEFEKKARELAKDNYCV